MQVIADTLQNAEEILNESLSLLDVSLTLCDACMPFQEWMRVNKQHKSPPVYVAETGRKMKEHFIENFQTSYPALASGIINGSLGIASYRINDGVFRIGNCLIKIKDRKFMIMSDDERRTLYADMQQAVADLVVFVIITFSLHQFSTGVCTLSVSKLCDRRQVNPTIFYAELLQILKDTGRTYYAYEQLSTYYNELLAVEPIFLAECEEQDLPLTEDLAQKILDGELTAAAVKEMLTRTGKGGKGIEEKEININPFSMISRMNLE